MTMSPTDRQRTSDNSNYHDHEQQYQHHNQHHNVDQGSEPLEQHLALSQPQSKHYYLLHYLEKIVKVAAILMLFTYIAIRSIQQTTHININSSSSSSGSRSAISVLTSSHYRDQQSETALPPVNISDTSSLDIIYL